MNNLEKILSDPAAAFAEPTDVLAQHSLSLDEKARVLRQWRYDLVQLQVASGENLTGDASHAAGITMVDECLRVLEADPAQA
jgi:hypothetical protein